MGRSVRLQIGNVDVILCMLNEQIFDEQIFLLHGIDVTRKKMIGLKSSNHFRAAFQLITKHIITVDSPGLTLQDISSFHYTKLNSPFYPMDKNLSWRI